MSTELRLVEPIPEITLTVVGEAKPGGSKKAFRHPHTGRIIVTEDSKNRSWRQEVAGEGARAMVAAGLVELLVGPLEVEMTFFRPRTKGHYGSGRNARVLKPSAPMFPTTRPDVLKLARAVEDSLTSVVWRDDSQIVDERLRKVFGFPERVEITIRPL